MKLITRFPLHWKNLCLPATETTTTTQTGDFGKIFVKFQFVQNVMII